MAYKIKIVLVLLMPFVCFGQQNKSEVWIGAKVGFFALREGITNDSGTVDIDWYRVTKN